MTFTSLAAVPDGPTPSDVIYDDMTRAWRNEDYPLAWSLADTLLQYEACGGPDGNGGEPLTGPDRNLAYVHAIHATYAPETSPADRPGYWSCSGYEPAE
jgi:hypothetical protein